MPKKLGINSKAVEARERKEATKKANQDKAAREAEDKLWRDDDKNLAKKQQRRDEEERKKADAARKKAEIKAILDQEISQIKTHGKQPLAKVSRQQVIEEMEKKQRALEALNAAKQSTSKAIVKTNIIEENLNRSMGDTIIATNIDEALSVLNVNDSEEDKHPEKRMRAAYKAFEAANLPRIKVENPSMRMSQWKQILMKEWNKSSDNPFNRVQ